MKNQIIEAFNKEIKSINDEMNQYEEIIKNDPNNKERVDFLNKQIDALLTQKFGIKRVAVTMGIFNDILM